MHQENEGFSAEFASNLSYQFPHIFTAKGSQIGISSYVSSWATAAILFGIIKSWLSHCSPPPISALKKLDEKRPKNLHTIHNADLSF